MKTMTPADRWRAIWTRLRTTRSDFVNALRERPAERTRVGPRSPIAAVQASALVRKARAQAELRRPVVRMRANDLEQLQQIAEHPVWDGNLINKTARDRLFRQSMIFKDPDARDPDPHAREVGAWRLTRIGSAALAAV